MGISADIANDWHASLAALAWQVELGVDEVTGDDPINRYDLLETLRPAAVVNAKTDAAPKPQAAPPMVAAPPIDNAAAVDAAKAAAARADSLPALREAMAAFDLCELKRGARNTVFADGNPKARVLVLGEAPGREEDIEGRPFVGAAGQLLDRMFAAIGLSRGSEDASSSLYLSTVMPWRPPGDRVPEPAELAMMRPFLERHIALVNPKVIVVMGNTALLALTGQRGVTRARGTWATALNTPVLPMVDPTYLLQNPVFKREAWADLLALQSKLRALH